MLKKNKHGTMATWDLFLDSGSQGEGLYNLARIDLEGIKAEIEAELINEDMEDREND